MSRPVGCDVRVVSRSKVALTRAAACGPNVSHVSSKQRTSFSQTVDPLLSSSSNSWDITSSPPSTASLQQSKTSSTAHSSQTSFQKTTASSIPCAPSAFLERLAKGKRNYVHDGSSEGRLPSAKIIIRSKYVQSAIVGRVPNTCMLRYLFRISYSAVANNCVG